MSLIKVSREEENCSAKNPGHTHEQTDMETVNASC